MVTVSLNDIKPFMCDVCSDAEAVGVALCKNYCKACAWQSQIKTQEIKVPGWAKVRIQWLLNSVESTQEELSGIKLLAVVGG